MAWVVCSGTALLAQGPLHINRVNGFGGFGWGRTGISSGSLFNSTYQDLSTELGLDATGSLYDPRLVGYNFSSFWDGNNTSVDQGRARSNGLSFNGNFSFLPERPFPFALTFSRNHSNTSGSLLTPFSYTNTLWGLRGEVKTPRIALISYSLGFSKTENDVAGGQVFNTRSRFANITATRNLLGWQMRLSDDYLNVNSSFSNYRDRTNTLSLDASRAFGERLRAEVMAFYSAFNFRDLSGANTSDSSVMMVNGNLTWKHTEKLDSFYGFNYSRNAINTLRLLATANGSNVNLPFNPLTLDSASENLSVGANYRPTGNLTLNAGMSYSHNGLPAQTLTTLPTEVRQAMATDLLNARTGYGYRHRIWKLEYLSNATLDWQHFTLNTGSGESGLGYSLDNGVTGGNVRKLRFATSFRVSRRSNPIFFNVVTSSDRRATLKLDSEYLRFVKFQGIADVGTTILDLAGSTISLDTSNYMLSAAFPKQRLNVFASRGVSSSLERFLGPDSILFQPGGGTGQVPIPPGLLNPLIYSDVASQRAGLGWRPRQNLEVEGRYSKNRYLFTFLDQVENTYNQWDASLHYKFGRFTITAGYGRANGQAFHYDNRVNRLYFRVRFPFHVL